MNEDHEECLKNNWITRWILFFEQFPNLDAPRNSSYATYLSQIRRGVGSWAMTMGFWEAAYALSINLPEEFLKED